MRNVRVWFTKLGQAKYISHLDINRCMARAVRRAQLPLWFTEGFNPHAYMTFSLPLPLGVESLCESMDIRVVDENYTNEMVKNNLGAVMPVGLNIVSVNDDGMEPKKIAYADYLMKIWPVCESNQVIEKIKQAIDSKELLAEKKSKSGRKKIMKTINLSEFIKDYSIWSAGETVELKMILSAGAVKNVNPVLMLKTILAKAGIDEEGTSILRNKLLAEDMTEFR